MPQEAALPRSAPKVARYPTTLAMLEALKPSYPVYCVRPEVLKDRARHFLKAFPGHVLYAVKCNPHPMVLNALYEAGVRHFDTASLPEIAQVAEMFSDARCYFHHPVKSRAAIDAAARVYGVRFFTVDHASELEKVLGIVKSRNAVIMVRMATPESGATYNLSAKFGAPPDQTVMLLRAVKKRGLAAGLAFHIGSQCLNPAAFEISLDIAKQVLSAGGVEVRYLDVGGGFPAAYAGVNAPPLESFFEAIGEGLGRLELPAGTTVMCEPGRALVADGASLITQVQLRKGDRLYINDGVYQSFSETVSGRFRMPARALRLDGKPFESEMDYTVYGPTCDSLDVLPLPYPLPEDVREGDWIEFGRMGAYTSAVSSHFNGFFVDTFVEIEDSSWP